MSGTTLFVGNLSYRMSDDDLLDVFKAAGQVSAARISRERGSYKSRGFGYVTFEDEEQAQSAIDRFNGTDVAGRSIRVEMSNPRVPRFNDEDGERPTFQRREYGQRGGGRGRYRDHNRFNGDQPRSDYNRSGGYHRRGEGSRGGYRSYNNDRNYD